MHTRRISLSRMDAQKFSFVGVLQKSFDADAVNRHWRLGFHPTVGRPAVAGCPARQRIKLGAVTGMRASTQKEKYQFGVIADSGAAMKRMRSVLLSLQVFLGLSC